MTRAYLLDIHWKADIAHGVTDLDAPLARVGRSRLDHQQIDVAVLRHLPRGCGTEQNDSVRPRYLKSRTPRTISSSNVSLTPIRSHDDTRCRAALRPVLPSETWRQVKAHRAE